MAKEELKQPEMKAEDAKAAPPEPAKKKPLKEALKDAIDFAEKCGAKTVTLATLKKLIAE